ncbi:hypothetical protein, partial [Streptococcus pneumoniae]|uniref:hypothetical protein n=1 Tax=Streptococcus pneumoniae TaxID=1313 RepID=UPI001E4F9E6B
VAGVDTFQIDATGIAIPEDKALTVGQLRFRELTPPAIGANVNDYAPADLNKNGVLRLSALLAVNITGLTGGATGRFITIHNIGIY